MQALEKINPSNLAISQNRNENVTEFELMCNQAKMIFNSKIFPQIKSEEQAITIGMMGKDLGLTLMQAVQSIEFIMGKPSLPPRVMLALIRRSGLEEDTKISQFDGEKVTVTMKRRGLSPHTETFSMADAKKMGLLEKSQWKNQPGTMCKWRAVSACARVVYSDILLGFCYTPEELLGAEGDVDPETCLPIKTERVSDKPILVETPQLKPISAAKSTNVSDLEAIDVQVEEVPSSKEEKIKYIKGINTLLKKCSAANVIIPESIDSKIATLPSLPLTELELIGKTLKSMLPA